jgi:hypothetical protein
VHGDVAGTCGDVEIDWSTHLEGALERTFCGGEHLRDSESNESEQQQETFHIDLLNSESM